MAKINVLSSQIANLIAAGEVVDRPASVAKELCENALDAGATQITIETRGGGTTYLRVTDNGCGMSQEDARSCVLRHATSKISTEEDLDAIATLGFRGEALAAISAVSHFSIITKRAEDEFGHNLVFESGEMVSCDPAGCPDGTTIMVNDLFYNQPARRKFLKRDATEQAALLQYMQRIAVAFPDVSFKCICDGAVKFHTPGDSKMLSAIRAIYGKEVSDTLFEVEYTSENLRVHGFISRPESARPTRSLQCFYVNERYVKSRTMLFAMDDAFKSFLKSDRHPVAFLFLNTDVSQVDVNVHPAKLEVRFSDERAVYRAIYTAIRTRLSELTNPFAPKQSYEPEIIPELPKNEQVRFRPLEPRKPETKANLHVASPSAAIKKVYPWANTPEADKPMSHMTAALFETKQAVSPVSAESSVSADCKNEEHDSCTINEVTPTQTTIFSEKFTPETAEQQSNDPVEETNNPLQNEAGRYLGAVFSSYLLYELDDILYVIDKHAAHERILYESLRREDPTRARQVLLAPVIIRLDAMEAAAIADATDELAQIGLFLDPFGEATFALREIPLEFSGLGESALIAMVTGFAEELLRGGTAKERRRALWDKTLFTVACKAAMKAGRSDSEQDCLWVIEQLKKFNNIFVCPHGRPIISSFDKHSFERLFFRA
ncbi:MAG: DNA mismatch repair endonuclease MutL [Clostridia bacterium]|nr:DNA mismatch repair endonuclease MutL [Clostridia bacterium]